jgi:hypothetical protein
VSPGLAGCRVRADLRKRIAPPGDDREESFRPSVMLCVSPNCSRGGQISTFKLLGAVAVLSSLSATPVLAQAVIQEPDYCAFFYPTAICQNKGPGNPYTDPNFHRTQGAQGWSSGARPFLFDQYVDQHGSISRPTGLTLCELHAAPTNHLNRLRR